MNLYTERFDLRKQGRDALVCGWGTVSKDEMNVSIGRAEYSENLHCLFLSLGNRSECQKFYVHGDFQREQSCARAKFQGKKITLVITMKNSCILKVYSK